ncbi:hypothetical protein [Psychrobacillus sp. FSL K6-2843]|uniref:hypothetical protein n=1 Tax=Psychrobacillus sp. FSL K6-2843 TaxID=2921549 RepID=UPI00315AEA89
MMMMTMNTVMTVMGDAAEDDAHVINTRFSLYSRSFQFTHHTHHTIVIHTTTHRSTVLMAINI